MTTEQTSPMSDEKREPTEDQQPGAPEAPLIDAGDDIPDSTPGPTDELAVARAEAAELREQLLRALAETENLRRRAQREKEDAQKFGIAGFARELVPVADNLRRALEAVAPEAIENDEALKTLVTGVEMTERQLLAGFEKHGLRRIEPLGQRFDSNLHQAMFEVPGTTQPAGTVVQVLQAGYVLNDRLIRPAMVGVAKGEPQPANDDGSPPDGGDGGHVDTVV